MKVRFLKDFEFASGKKAKKGEVWDISRELAFFLEDLDIAEPYIEGKKEAKEADKD